MIAVVLVLLTFVHLSAAGTKYEIPNSATESSDLCECFFDLQLTRDTDVGQRVAETLATMTMAEQHKCRFLFDRTGFTRGDYGENGVGEFSKALQFLHLHADELVLDDLRIDEDQQQTKRILHTLDLVEWPFQRLPHTCGTLFAGELAYIASNQPQICFAKFDNFKWRTNICKKQRATTHSTLDTHTQVFENDSHDNSSHAQFLSI